MKLVYHITFFILLILDVQGQHIKLLKNLDPIKERADRLYETGHYEEAALLYEKAFEKDTSELSIAIATGQSYYHIDQFKPSEKWFRIGMNEDHTVEEDILGFVQVLIANQKYDEAKEWLHRYKALKGEDILISKKLDAINEIHSHFEDSTIVDFHPLSINTKYAEFSPFYYKRGIIFLSDHHSNDVTNVMNWSDEEYISIFYTEELESGRMTDPIEFHSGLNSNYHEGPLVFFDTNKIIFTRAGVPKKKKDESHLELHYAEYDEARDRWINMEPLPFNSKYYSVGQPAISQDGSVLIFTSNMPGGYGGADLYISKKIDGEWNEVKNLGSYINSSGDDMFPFLVDDQLVFASDGHGGLGDLDLFRTPLNPTTHDEVKNLGYPFNSPYADFGFISDPFGRSGYFTSNRKNGGMDDDLFRFRIKWSKIRCLVLDAESQEPIENAIAQFVSGESLLDTRYTDSTGMVDFLAKPGEELLIELKKEGYVSNATTILTDDLFAGKSHTTAVFLEKKVEVAEREMTTREKLEQLYNRKKAMIQVNGRVYEYREVGNSSFIVNADESILLSHKGLDPNLSLEERAREAVSSKGLEMQEVYMVKNIYFDFASAELTEEAKEEMSKVVKIMTVDQKIAFAINSYTDSRGTMAANDELAFRRSQMIARYFLENDIPGSRLILDSYGEQGLLNDCDDDTQCEELYHAVNRRAEFELLMRKIHKGE